MTTRLNINVSDEVASVLRTTAERDQTTVTEQVRKAVSVYAFFRERLAEGQRVRLVDADENVTEVVWP